MTEIQLYLGDCLDILPTLEAGSVDAVITDPPYGTTACKWDTCIPFKPMWEQLGRIAKERAAIVLFGSQPFTSALVMSKPEWFKYEWVWEKTRPGDLFNAKNKPLKAHEIMSVFSRGTTANCSANRMTYYPQGLERVDQQWSRPRKYKSELNMTRPSHQLTRTIEYSGYPRSVLRMANPNHGNGHPTQKPVDLLEYLVKTYTNEGDTVLDFTMGSGTTGVACVKTGRNFIGIDNDPGSYAIAEKRIAEAQMQPRLEGI